VAWQFVLLSAAIVVVYAATGIGEGLRIALRSRVLRLMRVEDPDRVTHE
jgi:hypothetical protein